MGITLAGEESVELAEKIRTFCKASLKPILFTGAGVSVRAGLPTWKKLVEELAEGIRSSDAMTANMMRGHIAKGNLTLAADYFFMSPEMLEGDKRDLLKNIFKKYDAKPIERVACLPFDACLTTNFDRSIFDAISAVRKKVPLDFKLGDSSFKEALWTNDLYVARIHGASEAPESIVLSKRHFEDVQNSAPYNDLLRSCFVNGNVLFLGFSFYDPAIRGVFDAIDTRFGPATPGRHLAILPNDVSPEFIQKANRLNIAVARYDSSDDHNILWDAIAHFCKHNEKKTTTTPERLPAFHATKRYLAACYARAQTGDSTPALRATVIEGVVAAQLQEVAPSALSRDELQDKIRLALGVKGRTAEELIDNAIQALSTDGLIRRLQGAGGKGSKFGWKEPSAGLESMTNALRTLAISAKDRAFLQEGWKASESLISKLETLFVHMVARRGWDLGAAFARGRAPENVSVEALIQEVNLGLPAYDLERLTRVLASMFQNPTEEESRLLGQLGRVSFAVELAFQAPGSTLLHKAVLPNRIYFDASVLLPAIVDGHPLYSVYSDTLRRLRSAATSAAAPLHLKVCKVYLNEIISHRSNAEEYLQAVGADRFLEIAQSDATYHGAANVNVFVGAYANWCHIHEDVPFKEFLRRNAPYTTESELRKWLEKRGFEVVETAKGGRYSQLYSILERKYSTGLIRGKRPILIEHDALQLSLLDSEMNRSERAIFVTADRNLQEAIAVAKPTAHLSEVMLSHVGLVQMIELLLGGIGEGGGMADLLWSARISDKTLAMHSYLVNRALEEYDDGISMQLSRVVETSAEKAQRALDRDHEDLEAEDPKKRAQAFKKLGTLEANYFKGMRQAVEKLQEKE